MTCLQHLLHQGVDLVLAASGVTALVEMQALLGEATVGGRQLEGPQEVVGLLEGGADSVDLVDEVLHADDISISDVGEVLLDQGVIGDGDALLVDLGETALVDQGLDSLQVGVAPGDVGGHDLQHLQGGLVQTHEHGVVDLAQAQQLQHLADLGGDTQDTADADHEGELGLGLHEEVAGGAGSTAGVDQTTLSLLVLLHVLLGTLEVVGALCLGGLRGKRSGAGFQFPQTKNELTALAALRASASAALAASCASRFFRKDSGTCL